MVGGFIGILLGLVLLQIPRIVLKRRIYRDSNVKKTVSVDPKRWILESDDLVTKTEHLDGISWMLAPLPPKKHLCTPQTRGWLQYFTQIFRCACGGISSDGIHWDERNSRRDYEAKKQLAAS